MNGILLICYQYRSQNTKWNLEIWDFLNFETTGHQEYENDVCFLSDVQKQLASPNVFKKYFYDGGILVNLEKTNNNDNNKA